MLGTFLTFLYPECLCIDIANSVFFLKCSILNRTVSIQPAYVHEQEFPTQNRGGGVKGQAYPPPALCMKTSFPEIPYWIILFVVGGGGCLLAYFLFLFVF